MKNKGFIFGLLVGSVLTAIGVYYSTKKDDEKPKKKNNKKDVDGNFI